MKRKSSMTRTAKWHKHLSLDELRHMREQQDVFSIAGFKRMRAFQRELAERCQIDLWRICHECSHIEHKLKEAGVLK